MESPMHVPDAGLSAWICELVDSGKLYLFYKSPEWRSLRQQVMDDHHCECEMCADEGRYGRADTVHHEYEVKDFPELALTRYETMPDGTVREVLHPLCNHHHNLVHGRVMAGSRSKKKDHGLRGAVW